MANPAPGPYILFGILMGVMAMVAGFLFVISFLIRIPGAQGVRAWGMGAILAVVVSGVIFTFKDKDSFILGLLLYLIKLFAHLMMWRGIGQFFQLSPSRNESLVCLLLLSAYLVVVFSNASLEFRFQFSFVIPVVIWPLIWIIFAQGWPGKHLLSKKISLIGIVALMASNLGNLAGLYETEFIAQICQMIGIARPHVLLFLLAFVGALLGAIGFVFLFFERVLDLTNHAATHDELTKVRNRRAINVLGEREIAIAQRARSALTVAFIDVDFFKKINDQYGHDKGDLVLVELAAILSGICRNIDHIGRYGGEEFCLVFPGEDVHGAQGIGERLVQAVRAHTFTGLPPVTISVGLAVIRAGEAPISWHALVKLADQQLYKAKHSGRDRFCIDLAAAPGPSGFAQQELPLGQTT